MSETLREAVEALCVKDGWDDIDVASLRGRAIEAVGWDLIEQTMDTADREPSDDLIREAMDTARKIAARLAAPPPAVPDAPRTEQRGEGTALREAVEAHSIGFRTPTLALCSCGQWSHTGKDRECHTRWREHFARAILEAAR